MTIRTIAKGLTPPYLWELLKRGNDAAAQRREPAVQAEPAVLQALPPAPEWEYVQEGWARPARGWDVEAIARVYRESWTSFLEAVAGNGPLGVNPEVPRGVRVPRGELDAQQHVLAFAYALARAAAGKERLSLLDWGGGPGHYAVLARALYPALELDYHSRDLPALVALGREVLPAAGFHDGDGCLEGRYDLVMASSSLHYSEDWRSLLGALARAASPYLYVTRVPIALHAPSFVVLQRAHGYGYETEYLGWVLNRDELVEAARAAGLTLERELLLPAQIAATGAPEDPVGHRGYLFVTAGRI
jgi:putative methyltransferase (TIGR04325 family)